MRKSERAHITGDNGEQAVRRILIADGWYVRHDPLEDWDLFVEDILTVEVKTAHQSGGGNLCVS